ncbi:hypothetical protein QTI96_01600 [Clostridium perfringens]|nr:hypothetical protein [Clostridium perfringens]
MTITDLKDCEDELITLYNLLKPNDYLYDCSESMIMYYNSPQYRSKLYKFIKSLTSEQIDLLNKAIIIGCWLYDDITKLKYQYVQNPTIQNLHVYDIEKWCSKIRSSPSSIKYINIFLTAYLDIDSDI